MGPVLPQPQFAHLNSLKRRQRLELREPRSGATKISPAMPQARAR
jgi:hypothetical protein